MSQIFSHDSGGSGGSGGYDARVLRQRTSFEVCVLDRIDSTQAVARQWMEDGRFTRPTIIVAHRQTAGRGRGSNRWQADEGSLTVTFMLPAPAGDHLPQELALRAGLAVRQAIAPWVGEESLQVKWPNDVWLHGRKVAGLLCERRRGVDLVGLGLNVNVGLDGLDASIAQRAASIHQHLQQGMSCPSRQEALIAIAGEMASLWRDDDWCQTLNRVHALTGQAITIHPPPETPESPESPKDSLAGVCEGVDAQGRLLVRVGQRLHRLLDGTIEK